MSLCVSETQSFGLRSSQPGEERLGNKNPTVRTALGHRVPGSSPYCPEGVEAGALGDVQEFTS